MGVLTGLPHQTERTRIRRKGQQNRMDQGIALLLLGLLCAPTIWAQPTDSEPNSDCFHEWTGPDSGGSCSFKDSLCDWTNVELNDIDWNLKSDGGIAAFKPGYWDGESDVGWLLSPAMCETQGDHVCLKVKYKITGEGGTRLTMEVCGQKSLCEKLFEDEESQGQWVVKHIELITPGLFEIFIKAEIFDDLWGIESTVYIDYIQYNKTSCDAPTTVTFPTTVQTTELTDGSPTTGDSTILSTSTVSSLPTTFFSIFTSEFQSTETAGNIASSTDGAVSEEGSGDDRKEDKEETGQRKGMKEEEQANDEDKQGLPTTTIIVAVSVVMVIVLIVAVVVAVVLVRRHHGSAPRKHTSGGSLSTTSVTTAAPNPAARGTSPGRSRL